ncbi:MmgE/PrpD family protein [Desulfosporosinus sp. BICA1-9]|uniref:MmgE/PrpD family protein n=1 Tax=Desulfosporosinus sp. BICA1-9 TaxID=1531958 RepID=UPI000ABF9588|nr:MmgE/PrpD family protein [Desulfosporosinus sp. BICA1-9]HBW38065.1 MmgE/PrpD family protein [Desulfosporosinus sp.]
MHIWEPICEFIIRTKYDKLPAYVINQAMLTLLDTLGAMLAGSKVMPIPNMVESCYKGGTDPVTIAGYSVLMEPNSAALINGTSAVALEIDEGNQFAKGHPAFHVVPAALAWAEHIGASGKQLLESLVVGYELAARIDASTTLHDEVHPHGTWGTIGAAVAVAKLRGLSLQEVSRTIHLAAAMSIASAWSTALSGGTIRNVYTGLSNHLGMLAVDLARAGVNTGDGIVESVFGSILGTDFNPHLLIRDLGTSYYITSNYFKMYACCRYNHAAIDALQGILAEQPVTDDQIEKLEVETYSAAARLKNQRPQNMLAAKFSIPFALATYRI